MNSNNLPELRPMGEVQKMQAAGNTDPAAVASAEHAAKTMQMAYFMAAQKPRDEATAWQKIITSCERPVFAERSIYSKPVGGSKITGPTIRLAEEIIRRWGNILVKTAVVYEDSDRRRVSVQVIDLESNNQYAKEIVTAKTVERRSKAGREVISERINTGGDLVYILAATDEEVRTKEASEISKAVRNEGLRLIPSDVVDDALETCRRTMSSRDKADPKNTLKQLLYGYGAIGVTAGALASYLGCTPDQATAAQLADLRGVLRAIRDGETTWTAVMEAHTGEDVSAATEAKAGVVLGRLKERIAKERAENKPVSVADPDDFDLMDDDDLAAYINRVADEAATLSKSCKMLVKSSRTEEATRAVKLAAARTLAQEVTDHA